MKPMPSLIRECLDSLNANYGKGSISAVNLNMAGRGTFLQSVRFSHYGQARPKKLHYRILWRDNGLTVFALGHQKTIKT